MAGRSARPPRGPGGAGECEVAHAGTPSAWYRGTGTARRRDVLRVDCPGTPRTARSPTSPTLQGLSPPPPRIAQTPRPLDSSCPANSATAHSEHAPVEPHPPVTSPEVMGRDVTKE